MEGMRTSKELEGLQTKFQTELEKYTKAQKKNEKLVRLSSQLETQLQENEMVKEELGVCGGDARVFKIVGGVLIPQTLEEAKSNVNRRIEYIQNESKRNTELITTAKTELMELRETVVKMEQQIQLQQMQMQQGQMVK